MLKKKTVVLAFVAMMVMTMYVSPVSAASVMPPITRQVPENYDIAPQWTSTAFVILSIQNSGRNISVSLLITPKNSTEKSSGTLYLEQYSGGLWRKAKSWSISKNGKVDITKSYTGKSKVKYRAKVVVTTGSDKITAISTEILL